MCWERTCMHRKFYAAAMVSIGWRDEVGDARMSPGLDFPDSSPVACLLPQDMSLHLFPGPLSPAPRKAPHPACSPHTPHPCPSTQSPWLVSCAALSPLCEHSSVCTSSSPKKLLKSRDRWPVTYHRAGHTAGAAPCGAQGGQRTASAGSWAGLRLVVLADTFGTSTGFSWGCQPERP